MYSNISDPLPNKYGNPSEKVRKTSGDFDETEKALVTTTDTVVKEGNTDMAEKKRKNLMWWRNPSLLLFYQKKKIDTLKKADKTQASNKTVDTPRSNKTNKVKSIDKSRSTQRTETENTVNKSRYILRTNLSNKITGIEKPSEIDICKDDLGVSFLSRHGETLSSETPEQQRIPRKNKKRKTLDTLIIRKECIQEPVNPRK